MRKKYLSVCMVVFLAVIGVWSGTVSAQESSPPSEISCPQTNLQTQGQLTGGKGAATEEYVLYNCGPGVGSVWVKKTLSNEEKQKSCNVGGTCEMACQRTATEKQCRDSGGVPRATGQGGFSCDVKTEPTGPSVSVSKPSASTPTTKTTYRRLTEDGRVCGKFDSALVLGSDNRSCLDTKQNKLFVKCEGPWNLWEVKVETPFSVGTKHACFPPNFNGNGGAGVSWLLEVTNQRRLFV